MFVSVEDIACILQWLLRSKNTVSDMSNDEVRLALLIKRCSGNVEFGPEDVAVVLTWLAESGSQAGMMTAEELSLVVRLREFLSPD